MLLEQGENPKTVQMLLEHRDIETTLGIDAHILKEVYDESVKKLDSAYLRLIPSQEVQSNIEINEDFIEKFKLLLSNPELLGEYMATKIEHVS